MIVDGIDLSALQHPIESVNYPKPIKSRVAHIDADFLAYMCSYERPNEPKKSFEDMCANTDTVIEHLVKLSRSTKYVLHTTPVGSNKGGRFEIARLKPYQDNRKKQEDKPEHLDRLRDWMHTNRKGMAHMDCEADDGMSEAQYKAIKKGQKNLSIIVTKDKDLGMVPGYHMDWDTGAIIDVKGFGKIWLEEKFDESGKSKGKKLRGYGTKFFWAQMLMGDAADNISGIPKVYKDKNPDANDITMVSCGPVKAFEFLNHCKNDKHCKHLVEAYYYDYQGAVGFLDYTGAVLSTREAFESEAKLLWMRRNRHDPDDVLKWMKKIK